MRDDSTQTASPNRWAATALLAGLAATLLDFDWNLLQTRLHELHTDLLLAPAAFLFVFVLVLAASGHWLFYRVLADGVSPGARSLWIAGWISFLLLWVLFFNLSDSRFSLADLDSVLHLLAVTALAALGAWFVGRFLGARTGPAASGNGAVIRRSEDLLLLLNAALVLMVPFLLTEIILVKGVLSAGSIATILLFSAAILTLLLMFARHRTLFRRLAIGLVVLFLATIIVVGARVGSRFKPAESASGDHTTRPPIILITIDTLRADALGTYGGDKGLTPNLDALAKMSLVFERTYASSPWTLPSMASIMTGVSALVHNTPARSPVLPAELQTLAEALVERGYATAGVGRNAHLRATNGFSRGFDYYRFYPRTHLASSLGTQLLRAIYPKAVDHEATTTELTRRASDIVERFPDGPYFLWLHVFDPHIPYEPPVEFLPRNETTSKLGDRFGEVREVRSGALYPDREQRLWIQDLYEGEVRYVDDEIGQFLSTLKRLELFDPALIIVTSDHGEEFWEHGGFEHGHALNDKVIRVPLIIKPPRDSQASIAGRRIDASVSIASVRSTILEFADLPQGEPGLPLAASLVPHWDASMPESPMDPIVIGAVKYFGEQLSVVRGPYKYIRHLEDGREELYDLVADPSEFRNLASIEPELTLELAEVLDREVELGVQVANELGIGQGSGQVHMDKETERELRSLGYIE